MMFLPAHLCSWLRLACEQLCEPLSQIDCYSSLGRRLLRAQMLDASLPALDASAAVTLRHMSFKRNAV